MARCITYYRRYRRLGDGCHLFAGMMAGGEISLDIAAVIAFSIRIADFSAAAATLALYADERRPIRVSQKPRERHQSYDYWRYHGHAPTAMNGTLRISRDALH